MRTSIHGKLDKIGGKFLLAVFMASLAGTARGQLLVANFGGGNVGEYTTSGETINPLLNQSDGQRA